jgi:hypothetical protein
MKNSDTNLNFALYIPFHYLGGIILSNSHIMNILSGNLPKPEK